MALAALETKASAPNHSGISPMMATGDLSIHSWAAWRAQLLTVLPVSHFIPCHV